MSQVMMKRFPSRGEPELPYRKPVVTSSSIGSSSKGTRSGGGSSSSTSSSSSGSSGSSASSERAWVSQSPAASSSKKPTIRISSLEGVPSAALPGLKDSSSSLSSRSPRHSLRSSEMTSSGRSSGESVGPSSHGSSGSGGASGGTSSMGPSASVRRSPPISHPAPMTGPSVPSPRSSAMNEILVRNLPFDYGADALMALFEKFGEIARLDFTPGRISRSSEGEMTTFGSGLVCFVDAMCADRAFYELNGRAIPLSGGTTESGSISGGGTGGESSGEAATAPPKRLILDLKRRMRRESSLSSPATNIVIKGMPEYWTDENLERQFDRFGRIVELRVLDAGIGFVRFETHEMALEAIDIMHDTLVEGKRLKVQFAVRKKLATKYKSIPEGTNENNLYVKNLPVGCTQAQFEKIFSKFGKICSARMMNLETGFVRFVHSEDARKAITGLNGKLLDGCNEPMVVKFALFDIGDRRNKEDRPPRGGYGDRGRGRDGGGGGGVGGGGGPVGPPGMMDRGPPPMSGHGSPIGGAPFAHQHSPRGIGYGTHFPPSAAAGTPPLSFTPGGGGTPPIHGMPDSPSASSVSGISSAYAGSIPALGGLSGGLALGPAGSDPSKMYPGASVPSPLVSGLAFDSTTIPLTLSSPAYTPGSVGGVAPGMGPAGIPSSVATAGVGGLPAMYAGYPTAGGPGTAAGLYGGPPSATSEEYRRGIQLMHLEQMRLTAQMNQTQMEIMARQEAAVRARNAVLAAALAESGGTAGMTAADLSGGAAMGSPSSQTQMITDKLALLATGVSPGSTASSPGPSPRSLTSSTVGVGSAAGTGSGTAGMISRTPTGMSSSFSFRSVMPAASGPATPVERRTVVSTAPSPSYSARQKEQGNYLYSVAKEYIINESDYVGKITSLLLSLGEKRVDILIANPMKLRSQIIKAAKTLHNSGKVPKPIVKPEVIAVESAASAAGASGSIASAAAVGLSSISATDGEEGSPPRTGIISLGLSTDSDPSAMTVQSPRGSIADLRKSRATLK